MDPATAFGIAAGVIQLVQFAGSLVETMHDIHSSASSLSRGNEKTSQVADQLDALVATLEERVGDVPPGTDTSAQVDRDILSAAAACRERAGMLQRSLADLKPKKSRYRVLAVIGASVKTMHSGSKIKEQAEYLRDAQNLLDSAVLINLSNRMSAFDEGQAKVIKRLDLSALISQGGFASVRKQLELLADQLRTAKDQKVDSDMQTRDLVMSGQGDLRKQLKRQEDRAWEKEILQSLGIPKTLRELAVNQAYPGTYAWIFNESVDPEVTESWDNFVQWLQSQRSLYWISGKPGSGKSTMMKYLSYERQGDLKALSGQQRDSLFLHHFFWRYGDSEQRTINGMLASLLYQLLVARPDFFSFLGESQEKGAPLWDNAALLACLKRLWVAISSQKDYHVYIFIDGLDECQLDERRALLDIVNDLAGFDNFKVCVSSRPEIEFERRLGHASTLKMHELTAKDMRTFVGGVMTTQAPPEVILGDDRVQIDMLVGAICQKAEGVFLWAAVVTREVVDDLEAGDPPAVLFQRVDDKQSSLDGMFSQLLEKAHKSTYRDSALYLQSMLSWAQTSPSLFDFFLLNGSASLREQLPKYGQETPILAETATQLYDEFLRLRRQIIARCFGLVEFVTTPCRCSDLRSGFVEEMENSQKSRESYIALICWHFHKHCNLKWVHRTAAEFVFEHEAIRRLMRTARYTKSDSLLDRHKCLVFHTEYFHLSQESNPELGNSFVNDYHQLFDTGIQNLSMLRGTQAIADQVLLRLLLEFEKAFLTQSLLFWPENSMLSDQGQICHRFQDTSKGLQPISSTIDIFIKLFRYRLVPLVLSRLRTFPIEEQPYWASWIMHLVPHFFYSEDLKKHAELMESLLVLGGDMNRVVEGVGSLELKLLMGIRQPVDGTWLWGVDVLHFSGPRGTLTPFQVHLQRCFEHVLFAVPHRQGVLGKDLTPELYRSWCKMAHEQIDFLVDHGGEKRTRFTMSIWFFDYLLEATIPFGYLVKRLEDLETEPAADVQPSDNHRSGAEDCQIRVAKVRPECPECSFSAAWTDVSANAQLGLGAMVQGALESRPEASALSESSLSAFLEALDNLNVPFGGPGRHPPRIAGGKEKLCSTRVFPIRSAPVDFDSHRKDGDHRARVWFSPKTNDDTSVSQNTS